MPIVAMSFVAWLGLSIVALAVASIVIWLLLSGVSVALGWLGRRTGVSKRIDRFVAKQGDDDLSPQDRIKERHPGAGGYG
jgi:hypothetical protein